MDENDTVSVMVVMSYGNVAATVMLVDITTLNKPCSHICFSARLFHLNFKRTKQSFIAVLVREILNEAQ